MNHKIKWERWQDPFIKLIKSQTEEDDFEKKHEFEGQGKNIGPVIAGPMGIVPVHEGNTPSKLYKFWIAHTTFPMTKSIRHVINYTEGVESFDIFTPYRFRISVARLFDDDSVKSELEVRVLKLLNNDEKKTSEVLKKILTSKYKFWALLKVEGKNVILYDEAKEPLLKKIEKYKYESIEYSWE